MISGFAVNRTEIVSGMPISFFSEGTRDDKTIPNPPTLSILKGGVLYYFAQAQTPEFAANSIIKTNIRLFYF